MKYKPMNLYINNNIIGNEVLLKEYNLEKEFKSGI